MSALSMNYSNSPHGSINESYNSIINALDFSNESVRSLNDSFDSNDICGYDWHGSEKEHIIESFRYWCDGWLVLFTGFLGIVANIVCLAVLFRKRFRNDLFHRLLIAFAISDILVIIFCGGKYIFRAFHWNNGYLYTILYPYIIHPGNRIALCGSVFMTLAVTVERFLAICYGMQLPPYARKCHYYILSVVFLSVAINIPRFMESKIVWEDYTGYGTQEINQTSHSQRDEQNITENVIQMKPRFTTADLRKNPLYIKYYYTFFSGFTTAIIPVTLLIFLNFKSAFQYLKSSGRFHFNPVLQASAKEHQMRMFVMALGVVFTFFIFHTPRIIVDIWEFTYVNDQLYCHEIRQRFNPSIWVECLIHVSHLCIVLNSSINFAIYCVFGRTFREEFMAMIKPAMKCLRPSHSTWRECKTARQSLELNSSRCSRQMTQETIRKCSDTSHISLTESQHTRLTAV